MLPFTQPLSSPLPGVRRFGSNGSVGSFGAVLHTVTQSITSPLSDEDYFAVLPASWVALRMNPNPTIAQGNLFAMAYRRLDDTPTNGPGRRIFTRGFTAGDTTGLTSELHGSDEFVYNGDHTGRYLPFANQLFGPDELIYFTWDGGGANSLVWSIEWLQSPDPDLLRKALTPSP